MDPVDTQTFRFLPRHRWFAYGVMTLGAFLLMAVVGFSISGSSRTFALICGSCGIGLGILYLQSPAWRIVVAVDDDGLELLSKGDRRFRVQWKQVVRVVASPGTKTCFVDGGAPERSLLVPGPGASAPYDIEGKSRLYDFIVSQVDESRVETVELLETAAQEHPADQKP